MSKFVVSTVPADGLARCLGVRLSPTSHDDIFSSHVCIGLPLKGFHTLTHLPLVKMATMNEKFSIFIQISLKFVPKGARWQ